MEVISIERSTYECTPEPFCALLCIRNRRLRPEDTVSRGKKKGSLHSEPSLHKLINYKLNQIEFWWCKGTTKN